MDNKKIFIGIIVIAIIIAIGLMLFKSCEGMGQKNDQTDESPTEDLEASGRSAFINANIEMTCLIQNDQTLLKTPDQIQIKLTQIYSKHGLPTNDNRQMISILDKYENDSEVTNIIKNYSINCKNGSPSKYYPN